LRPYRRGQLGRGYTAFLTQRFIAQSGVRFKQVSAYKPKVVLTSLLDSGGKLATFAFGYRTGQGWTLAGEWSASLFDNVSSQPSIEQLFP